jgi:tetrahydromethanopterin S-methyltransferase subunit B
MAIKDAIQAVYNKVQADVSTASPEELAYLSTSLEKLSGQATIFDMMDEGELKKTELNELYTTLSSQLNVDFNDEIAGLQTQIDSKIQTSYNTLDSIILDKTAEYNALVTTKTDDINTKINTFETAVTDAAAAANAAATALTGAAAVANQQAINGSFFNLYFYGTMR